MLPADERRAIVAVHEAAHAVAFAAHRIPFEFVELARNGHTGRLLSLPHRSLRLQYAVCCLAGPVAEHRFTGIPLRELYQTACRTDWQRAREVAPRASYKMLLWLTADLVDLRQFDIRRVAQALLCQYRLSQADVRELLGCEPGPRQSL